MFEKIIKTNFLPAGKPVMIWDGECDFCEFWVMRWKKMTGDHIIYRPFQEAAKDFPDIPLKGFKKASRLIETDGSIYSGPDSAYRTYYYSAKKKYPYHRWYKNHAWFQKFSDHGYNWIAKHRSFMMEVTHAFFGTDPLTLKPLWLMYVFGLWALLFLIRLIF